MAEMSCNQLLLIEFAMFMLKINLPVINSIAVSLYNIIGLGGAKSLLIGGLQSTARRKRCMVLKRRRQTLLVIP